MSKLTYTNVEYDFYDSDALGIYLEINSSENPDATAFIELCYSIATRDINVDFGYGDPTYVPYGDTNVLYDDGFEINGVDTSEAVTFDGVLIWDGDKGRAEELDDPEEKRAAIHKETAELLKCTVEELEAFFAGLDKEFYPKVVEYLNEYYTENSDRLPDSLFEVDDWYDVDWD